MNTPTSFSVDVEIARTQPDVVHAVRAAVLVRCRAQPHDAKCTRRRARARVSRCRCHAQYIRRIVRLHRAPRCAPRTRRTLARLNLDVACARVIPRHCPTHATRPARWFARARCTRRAETSRASAARGRGPNGGACARGRARGGRWREGKPLSRRFVVETRRRRHAEGGVVRGACARRVVRRAYERDVDAHR